VVLAITAGCTSTSTIGGERTLPPLSTTGTTAPLDTTVPTTVPGGAATGTSATGTTGTTTTTTTATTTTTTTTVGPPPPTSATTVPRHVTWGGWAYYSVPRLGSEPVRGTGCGSAGGLTDVIPDGIWNVIVKSFGAAQVAVDVRCVYTGAAGKQRHDAACAADPGGDDCLLQSAGWFVVNASTRLRTMPLAAGSKYGVGAIGGSPDCPPVTQDRTSPDAPWRFMDSWIVIDAGQVTTVIAACPAG
jgi:hypothetical protein